jgi:hypothetical protein
LVIQVTFVWTGSYVYEKGPVQRKSTTFPNRGVENVKLDIFNPKILITRRVFIDDVIIFGKTYEEQLHNL